MSASTLRDVREALLLGERDAELVEGAPELGVHLDEPRAASQPSSSVRRSVTVQSKESGEVANLHITSL